jgi:hypothetical protein
MSHAPALLALLALACSAPEAEWQPVEESHFVAEDGSYSLELPQGWMRSGNALTRDGWEAQAISFNSGPVLDTTAGIDPSAPDLLLAMQDELASQPGVRVRECRPATLGGLPGFRMHFAQDSAPAPGTDPGAPGRTTEVVLYGAVEGDTLYAFSLENRSAASFARDVEAFELLVASFERSRPAQPTR